VSATTEFDVDWAQMPGGASLGDVPGVEVDAEDRVYAFTRGETPLVVFDRDGNVLTSWDRGGFDHTIRHCTLEGEVLQTIGTPGRPAPFMSGRPFNKPTNIAFGPQGDLYVCDGYGNAHIHRLSPDGELIQTWGESGSDPGQFYVPHDIRCDEQGFVYVADRENHRVQVFDGDGGVQAVWGRLHRPCGLAIAGEGHRRRVYVAELGPLFRNRVPFAPNLGSRVTVLDSGGDVLGRHGAPDRGTEPDQFIAPHGIAVDSRGDVYVGEVANGQWPSSSSEPVPPSLTTLRKLTGLGY
jgi:DNA-binding beta-propeller fold protein YncE